jgi:hypothetical protein
LQPALEFGYFAPERGCVVLDQPQPLGMFQRFCLFNRLRLVFDTPALHFYNTP